MRAGRVFTHLLTFGSGFPDGNVSWTLTKVDGTAVATDAITPTPGAVSQVLTVSGTYNALDSGALIGARDLTWSYNSAGINYSGDLRYTLEAVVPFPATCQGVRDKLGVTKDELPDEAIPLMDAYLEYRASVPIDSHLAGTSRELRLISNALEALAGLSVLPNLQLRLAAAESSGTDSFGRWSKVDWELISDHLRGFLAAASSVFNTTGAGNGLFITAGPATDPITGA